MLQEAHQSEHKGNHLHLLEHNSFKKDCTVLFLGNKIYLHISNLLPVVIWSYDRSERGSQIIIIYTLV